MPVQRKTETDQGAVKTGLACPRCGCRHLPVLFTRHLPNGKVRRTRECRHCGQRLRTLEQPVA